MTKTSDATNMSAHKFIDLFAGCGGLSLGLSMAGLEGQFAIERDPMAFDTFAANFLGDRKVPIAKFTWPSWLNQEALGIDDLLLKHHSHLVQLNGKVEVLAGGPPCQGFSFAGKRQESDPRNLLFEKYVQVVKAIQPSALVLENVPGMRVAHISKKPSKYPNNPLPESYYEKLKRALEDVGYDVRGEIVDASGFGVPQKRSRLIVIGIRRDISERLPGGIDRAFELLEIKRQEQLLEFKLSSSVSAQEAISDLRAEYAVLKPCTDPYSRSGFEEADYIEPDSTFQKLMHKFCRKGTMNSMRLAKHHEEVSDRFARILDQCRKGVRMNDADRAQFGIKKHRIHPMSANDPAPTITTLPDDVLHYSEPRILTVRESARLQSFPDWFQFRGKFTTGGKRRTKECPRYTQVGNAVPPLLGRAIGLAIDALLHEANQKQIKVGRTKPETHLLAFA